MVITMLQLSAGEFKTHCLKLMDLTRDKRETILITKRGVPIAKLIPYDDNPPPIFGFMKGSITIKGDILEPLLEKWTVADDL